MASPKQVQIEKVIFGGAGLARINEKVCFIDDVLPGEKVEIEILEHKKNFSRGKLLRVLEPSSERIKPLCSYANHCGGCQYQHMTYEEELRIKSEQVREAFVRGLKMPEAIVQPLQFHPDPTHYRNHVTLHPVTLEASHDLGIKKNYRRGNLSSEVDKSKSNGVHPFLSKNSKTFRLGYIGRDHRTPFALDHCPIASEKLRPAFQMELPEADPEARMTFSLSEAGDIFSNQGDHLYPVKIAGHKLLTHSKGFFQNHLQVSEKLLHQIKVWAGNVSPEIFLDLYAGAGLFGLLASTASQHVIFVEENPYSLQALRENLKAIDKEGRKFDCVQGRSEVLFGPLTEKLSLEKMLVVLDPPRTGLDPEFARTLAASKKLKAMIYISCDLAILIRDLKLLLGEGNFEIAEVVPFDMFPRTKHIETAVFLKS